MHPDEGDPKVEFVENGEKRGQGRNNSRQQQTQKSIIVVTSHFVQEFNHFRESNLCFFNIWDQRGHAKFAAGSERRADASDGRIGKRFDDAVIVKPDDVAIKKAINGPAIFFEQFLGLFEVWLFFDPNLQWATVKIFAWPVFLRAVDRQGRLGGNDLKQTRIGGFELIEGNFDEGLAFVLDDDEQDVLGRESSHDDFAVADESVPLLFDFSVIIIMPRHNDESATGMVWLEIV
eukprot:GABV01008601.1.p1 GENE.GABV01008601.1~~GABV01008601.1.p1  ORF type:complete len:233 (+),score=69.88 GABV01008601.1:548-1246(+)